MATGILKGIYGATAAAVSVLYIYIYIYIYILYICIIKLCKLLNETQFYKFDKFYILNLLEKRFKTTNVSVVFLQRKGNIRALIYPQAAINNKRLNRSLHCFSSKWYVLCV